MYNTIVNPETGRKVKINGKIGKKVLNSYKKQFQLGGVPKKRTDVAGMIAMTSDPRHAPWWEKREEYIRKITWPIAAELTREQFPWNLDDDALHWIPRIAVVLGQNNKDLLDWMWEDAQMDSEKAVDELHQLVDYLLRPSSSMTLPIKIC